MTTFHQELFLRVTQTDRPLVSAAREGIWSYSPDHPDSAYGWNLTCPDNASLNATVGERWAGRPAYTIARVCVTLFVLGTITLAAVIGNVFVIAAVLLERNLHNVANYLVTSLASADLMVATLVMPLSAVNEVSVRWFLGQAVCDTWVMFDVICCTASILHLVAISMDRYWAVTRVAYIHNRSARRILLMVAGSWGLALAISVPPLFFKKDPDYDSNASGVCMINQSLGYQIFSTVGAFYVPFVAVMIIYLRVFLAARARIRKKRFRQSRRRQQAKQDTSTVVTDAASIISNASPTDGESGGAGGAELSLLVRGGQGRAEAPRNGLELSARDGNGCEAYEATDMETRPLNEEERAERSPPSSPQRGRAPCGREDAAPPRGLPAMDSVSLRSSLLDLSAAAGQGLERRPGRDASPRSRERKAREKVERRRERKAARTLAIITGSFCICWLPFFIVALTRPFCGNACHFPRLLLSVINWLGYLNSLLNPIIYTIFNPDFRSAFRKILFGKYRRQKYHRAGKYATTS